MSEHKTPLMGKSKRKGPARRGHLRRGGKRQSDDSRFAKAMQYVSRNRIKVEPTT